MGLLDELEKEAARLQKDGDDDAAQRERLAAWEERLKPAVERFGEYLTRLASTLTAARRRIRLVYPIAGYGDAVAFGEAPFECRVTPATTQVEFEFTFAAQVSPEESTLVVAETPGKVRLVNGLLQNHRLSGLHDVTKNANGDVVSGRFQARGRVPVRVHGIATLDSAQLKLTITNVEAFGTLQRSFTAEALTEETFDALGRYLLRENPAEFQVRDYGAAILLVPYFMRRPYDMLLVIKDTSRQYLHELTEIEMRAVTQGIQDAIRALMCIMPRLGREPAFNMTVNNGPGAGLYLEFLAHTQEIGGFEQLGLWVCQESTMNAAAYLRKVLA